MTLVRRLTTAALAAVMAGSLVAAPAAGAGEPVPTTRIRPAALDRGADISVPYVRKRTIVDGPLRITLDAPFVRLLGKAGSDYVVHVARADHSHARILRVTPSDERATLLNGVDGFSVHLSSDGSRLANAVVRGTGRTIVKEWSATTGVLDVQRSFDGVVSILDFAGSTLVLGASGPARTFTFDVAALETHQLSKQQGYAASVAGDRLATYTGDPYHGGCTRVSKLTAPKVELWSSCRQRVERFSPTGRRVATVALLSDGVGPDVVRVLASRGRTLARYSVDGWFAQLRWETDRRLLLDANGSRQFAVVRCVAADCQRATGLSPAQSPRQAGRRSGSP
jgi:hypothetical protein